MRLGFVAGYGTAQVNLPMDLVLEAERPGFDSVWTSEAYGADAVSTAAWILARTTRIRVSLKIGEHRTSPASASSFVPNVIGNAKVFNVNVAAHYRKSFL